MISLRLGILRGPGFLNLLDISSLGSIPYVEASHLALSNTENVSDRLVFKPVRLPLERFAFEIADGLPDFRDDRAIRSSTKAHRLDVRTDHGPLARPVLAYCFAPTNVATIHTVGPGDIIGEHGQHAVNVPRVKAIVDALEEFDITIHWFSPWHGARGHRNIQNTTRYTALAPGRFKGFWRD
jgi:hypothetical protein